MCIGRGAALKRLIVKIGHGFSRLAFWRKPVEASLESPAPEIARRSTPAVVESIAAMDDPARQAGWFARLKQTLQRNQKPAPKTLPEPEIIAAVTARPSRKSDDADATLDEAPPLKPSWLARLKGALRRQPSVAELESVEDTSTLRPEKTRVTPAPGHDDTDADEDAIPVSGMRRVGVMLLSKRVWIPGVSVVLIAILATMAGMLMHSGQEKRQLQAELLAAQQKLKQANTAKKVALGSVTAHAARPSQAVASASENSAQSNSGAGSGDCEISNPQNVAENLKNCINSFNAMTN
jgi:hypothetical protein